MSSFSPIRNEINRCKSLGAQLQNRPAVASAYHHVLDIIREMGLAEVVAYDDYEDDELDDDEISARNSWLEETKRRVAIVFEEAKKPGNKAARKQ